MKDIFGNDEKADALAVKIDERHKNKADTFKNNNIWESDRTDVKYDPSCASYDQRFDEINPITTDVIKYLQQSKYAEFVETARNGQVQMQIEHTNVIFADLNKKFGKSVDTVELFSCMMDYFGFEGKYLLDSLTIRIRNKLTTDLKKRLDYDIDFRPKLGGGMVQRTIEFEPVRKH